jgi:hypothetical protein
VEFLLCPAAQFKSNPEQLKFRNQLLSDHYQVASLLRLYEPRAWYYGQFCFELKQYVVVRWEESSVKKSWEQTRKKKI